MMESKNLGTIAYLCVLGIPKHRLSNIARLRVPSYSLSEHVWHWFKHLLRRVIGPHILIEQNLGIPKPSLSDIPPYIPPNVLFAGIFGDESSMPL